MLKMKKGFFAYSSEPKASCQAVESAIEKINASASGYTRIRSWRELKPSGKLILTDVINAIDSSDYFCADLTSLSDNVLFELGYAITTEKPIWLTLDTSHIEAKKNFQNLNLLKSIGYSEYHSTKDIINEFFETHPYERDSALNSLKRAVRVNRRNKLLLFLKGQFNTNTSQIILDSISSYSNISVIDDPEEIQTQSITWYLERLLSTKYVLIEFSSESKVDHKFHNSKCSLVAGMAFGLNNYLLMVSEEPYNAPIDYRDLLQTYKSEKRCREIISIFLNDLGGNAVRLLSQQKTHTRQKKKQENALQKVDFGSYLAEDEVQNIYSYYVPSQKVEGFGKKEYSIVIGRKGSGKTATLYYLKDFWESESKNHVCIIKPISLELKALLYLIENLSENYQKSFLIESSWKFLIYTEIIKSIYDSISIKPPYSLSQAESNLIFFVKENEEIILKNFSLRLEEELINISQEQSPREIRDFKVRVSEALHDNILSDIRNLLAEIFNQSDHKIYVLIDNLDKSWEEDENIKLQSELILGLLGVTGRIAGQLSSFTVRGKKFSIGFNLTLFLRSDIFAFVRRYAREADKIEHTKLDFQDKFVLFRIIEERFNASTGIKSAKFWEEYVVKQIGEEDSKDYIFERIIPRPRDIIFFLKEAQNIAINRGKAKIEVEDLEYAYESYSEWLVTALLSESDVSYNQMQSFLFQLVGLPNIINERDIVSAVSDSDLDLKDEETEDFIDYLVYLSILGREVRPNEFRYEYGFEMSQKNKALAKKMSNGRFRIHNSLLPYLECEIVD
jgi:hypothetical protein